MLDRDNRNSLPEDQLSGNREDKSLQERVPTLSIGRFVDRLRRPIALKVLGIGISGTLAVTALGTEYGPDFMSHFGGLRLNNTSVADSTKSDEKKIALVIPEISPELDQKLEIIFEKTRKEIALEIAGMNQEDKKEHLSGSPEEILSWFNDLDTKQKASVFMYGLMALYTLRAAGRYSKAFLDPRGEIDPKNLKISMQEYVRNNFGDNNGTGEKVTTKERLLALEHTVVSDSQNRRTAIALGGFTTASVIGVDTGEMGSLELNLTLVIASLLAAIQPPFKAFDRFKEKMSLEIIQKTAPFFAGSLYGIVGAGLYFEAKDISVLNAWLAGTTFATLFAYADMGIGSREYFASFVDTLNLPEDLRRFHILMVSKRIPHIDRQIFEALAEGRIEDAIFKGTAQVDGDGNIVRNTPLLDEAFAQLEKAFKEDDPHVQLDVPLPLLKEQVAKSIREYAANNSSNKENEDHKTTTKNARRRRSKGVVFKK